MCQRESLNPSLGPSLALLAFARMRCLLVDIRVRLRLRKFEVRNPVVWNASPPVNPPCRELAVRVSVNNAGPFVLVPPQPKSIVRLHVASCGLPPANTSASVKIKQLKMFSHNLPDLWAAFKAEFQNPALSDFDSLVTDLHEFDELRYPDSTLANGMEVMIGMTRVAGSGLHTPRPEPLYELYLDEIDPLVGKIRQEESGMPHH